ncbi:MAG: hypothetical protein ACOCYO_07990, partial [Bacteroidota bacterium]
MLASSFFNFFRSKSIRFKLFFSQNTLNILLFLLIIFFIYRAVNNQLNSYFDETIEVSAGFIQDEMVRLQEDALEAGEWFENSDRLVQALENQDRQEALKLAQTAMSAFGLHYFVLTDEKGDILIRGHAP